MTVLNRLERSLGWMAIGNLPLYVVSTQAILYIWTMMNPQGAELLSMDPVRVVYGREYWRLFTFLFQVPDTFTWPIFAFFFFYFQYICGQTLEQEWGSFPFTIFYLTGALGAIGAAFLVGHELRGAFFLNETIFLAFAALYPDFQILLFFILPVKIKWIAWFSWFHILFSLIRSPGIYRVAILLSLINYFLFFSKQHFDQVRSALQRYKHRRNYKDFNE